MNDEEMITCTEPSKQLERLIAIMHRLRAPHGCPWDAVQTHQSLIPNMIEEAYEAVDAIKAEDDEHLREELGDVLLQVVFHAELAEERGKFDFNDLTQTVCEKLIRRHPHVFGNTTANTPEAVLLQWDKIKRVENSIEEEKPYLHKTAKGLPAMMRATKLQKKAAKIGFDWPDADSCLDKVKEELKEVEETAAAPAGDAHAEEEVGNLFFALVNYARKRGMDPEVAMAEANAKFERRFGAMEKGIKAAGLTLEKADLTQMEAEWQKAKVAEKNAK